MIKKSKFNFLRFLFFSSFIFVVFSISSFAYTSSDFPSGVFNDVDQVSVSIDTTEISNYLSSSQIENLRSDYGDVYMVVQASRSESNDMLNNYIIDDVLVGKIFQIATIGSSVISDYSEFSSILQGWGFALPQPDMYKRAFFVYSSIVQIGNDLYTEEEYLAYGQNQYSKGYLEGKTDGLSYGYNEGYSIGKSEGISEGYENGYSDGNTNGYNQGYEEGYDFGLSSSYDTAYQTGFSLGYKAGEEDGILIT